MEEGLAAPAVAPQPALQTGYWAESRAPLASLVFVAPLLAVYELGVLLAPAGALRNGADVWLRQLLDWIGLGHYFLLPALTVVTLLAWHHVERRPWRVRPAVLAGMAIESGLLAVALLLIGRAQQTWLPGLWFHAAATPAATTGLAQHVLAATGELPGGLLDRLVLFAGAGIYEEVLFRLLLLSGTALLLRWAGLKPVAALATAIAVTSLVFAAAHYVGPHGDRLELDSFVFRTVAGAFFGTLFAARGFGIAVGAHAGYDVLAGCLLG
jgi:hypothetical protein